MHCRVRRKPAKLVDHERGYRREFQKTCNQLSSRIENIMNMGIYGLWKVTTATIRVKIPGTYYFKTNIFFTLYLLLLDRKSVMAIHSQDV